MGAVQNKVVAMEAASTTSPTMVEVKGDRAKPSPQKRNMYLPPYHWWKAN